MSCEFLPIGFWALHHPCQADGPIAMGKAMGQNSRLVDAGNIRPTRRKWCGECSSLSIWGSIYGYYDLKCIKMLHPQYDVEDPIDDLHILWSVKYRKYIHIPWISSTTFCKWWRRHPFKMLWSGDMTASNSSLDCWPTRNPGPTVHTVSVGWPWDTPNRHRDRTWSEYFRGI